MVIAEPRLLALNEGVDQGRTRGKLFHCGAEEIEEVPVAFDLVQDHRLPYGVGEPEGTRHPRGTHVFWQRPHNGGREIEARPRDFPLGLFPSGCWRAFTFLLIG